MRARVALAIVVAALACIVSLGLQRAIAEPTAIGTAPVADAPIPLFAGIWLALLHGSGAAATMAFAVDEPGAGRWLDRIIRFWPLIAAILAAGLVW